MKSKICSSKYVKTVSKGKGWIPAFLTLGFLLAFPVVSLLLIGNWMGLGYTSEQMELLYANLWRDGFLLTGAAVAVLAAILNGINGFVYLYSRKRTDFYHSLPVRRSRMFWNRVYTGLVYYLVPYVIMEFLTLCIGAARGFFSLKLMASALALCILHLILYLMVYFSVVLIFCITGHLLMGTFCLLGLYFYGPMLSLLLGCYRYGFYDTYYMVKPYGLIRFLRESSSPAGLAGQFAAAYGTGEGLGILLMILLLTVVFAVLSYIAYLKRPSEAAGEPMVYPLAALVVKLLVVVPCGMAAGYIFYLIPTSSRRIFWWIFGLILGTILTHGLVETAYQMDFHCFFKKRLQLLATGILVAACALVYQTDLFHFDEYIPSYSQLASVGINMNVFSSNLGTYVTKLENDTYEVSGNSEDWVLWEYHQPGKDAIGEKTYEAFRKIVENQKGRGGRFQEEQTAYEESSITFNAAVMYKLKSGKKVYRTYRVTAEESKELMMCLYEEENLKESALDFLNLDIRYLDEVYFNAADGRGYSIFQGQKEQWEELLEALEKDIKNAEPEVLIGAPCSSIQLTYLLPGNPDVSQLVPGEENRKEYAFYEVNILPEYKNTLAILKETGYPVSIEEVSVKKATITYYGSDREKTVVYEKPEELQAIKEAFVPMAGYQSWLELAEDMSVLLQLEQGSECYAELLMEKLPDFVKKEMEAVDEPESGENEEQLDTAVIGGADGPTSIILK